MARTVIGILGSRYCGEKSVILFRAFPGVYADLVTVAGFKPVVASEKAPGGFDSLPLPLLLCDVSITGVKPCEITKTEPPFAVQRQMKFAAQNPGDYSLKANCVLIGASTTLEASIKISAEPRMNANERE